MVFDIRKKLASAAGLAGVDTGRLASVRNMGRFLRDRRTFLRQGGQIDLVKPILFDFDDQAGSAQGHYFHQDLLVAQFVHAAKPATHVDVASRIDGFVAHVAAFRAIDVIDVRPLRSGNHPNIRFIQADLMNPLPELRQKYDSVSCLHAIEHFGLGRYTDPIAVDGHLRGFAAIQSLVAPGGTLYISFPIGAARVEFNAQRVFDPADLVSWLGSRGRVERFDFVDDAGDLHKDRDLEDARGLNYGCGIYTVRIY